MDALPESGNQPFFPVFSESKNPEGILDALGRKIEYLRLSVIDSCNIRCHYCMPSNSVLSTHKQQWLSFEEIRRLVEILVFLGIKSVRITGGEPLLRPDLPRLVAMLRPIFGLEELVLTTNGILLESLAEPLKRAGLSRLNIHLDTLNPARFGQITRFGNLQSVLSGLRAAKEVGFSKIKLNAVLQKGLNDGEIFSLIEFAAEEKLVLRFIELMPIGVGKSLSEYFLPTRFVLDQLSKRWTLVPYSSSLGRGPAQYFKILELNSIIGLIHPVSEPFCDRCNRIRISADGRFQGCLAYEDSLSLKELLRHPALSEETLTQRIAEMIGLKRSDHGGFLLPSFEPTRGMFGIGG